jgi:hypothetical protein
MFSSQFRFISHFTSCFVSCDSPHRTETLEQIFSRDSLPLLHYCCSVVRACVCICVCMYVCVYNFPFRPFHAIFIRISAAWIV